MKSKEQIDVFKELEPPLATETRTKPRKGGIVTTDIASGLINMGYLQRQAPSVDHDPDCFGWTRETPIIAKNNASQIQTEWLSPKSSMPHPTPASVTT